MGPAYSRCLPRSRPARAHGLDCRFAGAAPAAVWEGRPYRMSPGDRIEHTELDVSGR